MKIFLAHSFSDEILIVANDIKNFLESIGHNCCSGEKPENKGISQKVKQRIDDCDLFMGLFTIEKDIIYKETECYAISNWVIQESGFAIGKEKELIFLVENGIKKFPELQGDLELVYFDRENISKSFTKISFMINSINDSTVNNSSMTENTSSETSIEEKRKLFETVEPGEEVKDEIFTRLMKTLNEEKDFIKARTICEEYQKTLENEDDRIAIKAKVLRISHKIGDNRALKQLKQLCIDFKSNSVVFQLALRYKEMMEYHKAKEEFLVAGNLLDLTSKENLSNYLICQREASICLALDNQCDTSYTLLSELLETKEFNQYRSSILMNLSSIAKKCEDKERFIIYGEASLDLDPSNANLRFEMALKHSDLLNNELSLLHNKKLIGLKETGPSLNNLAVQFSRLDMPINAIKYYSKASKLKNTIAMANLANLYSKSGFIQDADELINDAYKLGAEDIEVSGNIGVAKNKIKKIMDKENAEEKNVLIEAEKERKFRVRHSNAFISNNKINGKAFNGIWIIDSLEVPIILKDNCFNVDEEFIMADKKSKWIKVKSDPFEYYKIKALSIDGSLENLSGQYEIECYEESNSDSLSESYEAKGYMIIKNNFKEIEIMEKSREKLKFKKWTKKEN